MNKRDKIWFIINRGKGLSKLKKNWLVYKELKQLRKRFSTITKTQKARDYKRKGLK